MNITIPENLENYLIATIIVILTIIVANLFNRFISKWLDKSTTILNNDPTDYFFLRKLTVALIYIVGFGLAIFTIPSLRHMASTLLAGAGVFAVAIGFASQQALSNIISGLFIVMFKPFKINDRIQINDLIGVVEDITLRHTVIKSFENKRIIVPNSIISNELIINSNYTEDAICKLIDFSIDYNSDIKLAKSIIYDEVKNHPLNVDGRTDAEKEKGDSDIVIRVVNLGESSVDLKLWAWAKNPNDGYIMSCDLKESIKIRFDKEGIAIPFPHRTIVYKNSQDA